MDAAAPHPRARLVAGGLLVLAAVAAVAVYLAFPTGSHGQALASQGLIAASCFLSGGVILRSVGRGHAWSGATYVALALFMLGVASLIFLGFELRTPGSFGAGPVDLLFLLFLLPI